MHTSTGINGYGPGGQAFSDYFPKITVRSNSFSGRDVLHTAVHNPNGFFVTMQNNFLSENSRNVAEHAARYHQSIGSANSNNILPRILVSIKNDQDLAPISKKIERLLQILEFFSRVAYVPVSSPSERATYAREIVSLVQSITNECRELIKE